MEELGRLIPSGFGDRAQDCDRLFLTAERVVAALRTVFRQHVVEGLYILTCMRTAGWSKSQIFYKGED